MELVICVGPRSLSRNKMMHTKNENKTVNNHPKIISSNTHSAHLVSAEPKTDFPHLL